MADSSDATVARVGDRLSAQLRVMQAEIIKAMETWHDSVLTEFRRFEVETLGSLSRIEHRMGDFDGRLSDVEKRLQINPPAA